MFFYSTWKLWKMERARYIHTKERVGRHLFVILQQKPYRKKSYVKSMKYYLKW